MQNQVIVMFFHPAQPLGWNKKRQVVHYFVIKGMPLSQSNVNL